MNIDCADGEELAYDGCIEMDLDVIGRMGAIVETILYLVAYFL